MLVEGSFDAQLADSLDRISGSQVFFPKWHGYWGLSLWVHHLAGIDISLHGHPSWEKSKTRLAQSRPLRLWMHER
jgi:hypothetical protein